jgi:4'-phosphopantetheinyl transferase EntD
MSLERRISLIRSLVADDEVVVEGGDPRLPSEPLTQAEAALVERAIAKRKLEFAKGRECARRALRQLGVEGFSLLNGTRRAPLWPSGVVGTVTHCRTFCAVAVARRNRYAGIGLDAELDAPVDLAVQRRHHAECGRLLCRSDHQEHDRQVRFRRSAVQVRHSAELHAHGGRA